MIYNESMAYIDGNLGMNWFAIKILYLQTQKLIV